MFKQFDFEKLTREDVLHPEFFFALETHASKISQDIWAPGRTSPGVDPEKVLRQRVAGLFPEVIQDAQVINVVLDSDDVASTAMKELDASIQKYVAYHDYRTMLFWVHVTSNEFTNAICRSQVNSTYSAATLRQDGHVLWKDLDRSDRQMYLTLTRLHPKFAMTLIELCKPLVEYGNTPKENRG